MPAIPAMPMRRAAMLGACAVATLSACAGLPVGTAVDAPAAPATRIAEGLPEPLAREVVMLALSLVGTPYRYGGNTPEGGFDCSGLIVHVFRGAAGLALPRTVAQLASVGSAVPSTQMRSADLVFFHATGRFSHAGICVDDGRFVHAPSSGGRVRVESIGTRYWAPRLAVIRRV